MNLKAIYELVNMSTEQLTIYFSGLNEDEIDNVIAAQIIGTINRAKSAPPNQIPLSDKVFYKFLIYALFNDDIEFYTLPNNWCIERLVGVTWGVDKSVLLTAEQLVEFNKLMKANINGDLEVTEYILHSNCVDGELFEFEKTYCNIIGILVETALPENSGSLNVKDNTSRFSRAVWFEAIQQKTITLAGVGGIGSYVGFLLARFHPKSLFIYDDDIVEAANMSGQLYGSRSIGRPKVDALADMVGEYADFHSVFALNQKFTEDSEPSDIMICGFDNIEARKLFYNKWVSHVNRKPEEERKHCLFIDGRLAAEDLQVLCITGEDSYNMDRYSKEFLFSSEEADATVCSYKQTTYMANMIGSIIANLFVNFVSNELLGFLGRDLPFFTQYSGLSMQFKVE